MSYQSITGPLMANSHPGSYSGQDAYSDMLVTDHEHICDAGLWAIQRERQGIRDEGTGPQGCYRPDHSRGGVPTWKLQ